MASAEQRANKKEDLIFLTSGAKEKLDKTMASMKGAARVMTHPFDKEAREQVRADTAEEKSNVEAKQAAIRAAALQQGAIERAAADGVTFQSPDVPAHGSEPPHPCVGDSEIQRSDSGSGSDASARARAQIPPSSAQYQSA